MKKYLLLFLAVIAIALGSCKKDSTTNNLTPAQQAVVDDAAIQSYMTTNNITAIKDTSGLYYEVIKPGAGAYPNINATIRVNSVGKLLNGTVFDTETSLNTVLSGNIQGWQIGLQHINTGGRILLLIPSRLAYGTTGSDTVPANSVLIFTVDLLGFN